MNKQLNIQHLYIALKEIYLPNRLLIVIFPLVMLLAFGLYYYWPGNIFYQKFFTPELYPTNDDWVKAVYRERTGSKLQLMWLVPIYLAIMTWGYFDALNKSERVNMLPLSNLERTLAIMIFFLGGLITGTFIFGLYDHLSVWLFENMYYEQVLLYLEKQGDLYPKISGDSIFDVLPINKLTLLSIGFFVTCVPLYILAKVFFKRYSIILFSALLVLIILVVSYVIRKSFPYEPATISIGLKGFIPSMIQLLIIAGYCFLTIAAFYYKRKEREI